MNTFGNNLRLTTFGESHGKYIGGVLDGFPAGFSLSAEDLQPYMQKRRPGFSDVVSPRRESDEVEIISGLYQGRTLGSPIAFLIKNNDQRSVDYKQLADIFRPGHADHTYHKKYGLRDPRGGGRASARETACRVAAGAIVELALNKIGINIVSRVVQIGTIKADTFEECENKYNFASLEKISQIEELFEKLRVKGDSCGAVIRTIIYNCPIGLGEPVYQKINTAFTAAMMSINAVKGVSIGMGLEAVTMHGSQSRDAMDNKGYISNNAGGILGGITNGEPILIDTVFKATSSIKSPINTQNNKGDVVQCQVNGRHDPCVGVRAPQICTAMAALTLFDHITSRYGQLKLQELLSSSEDLLSLPEGA